MAAGGSLVPEEIEDCLFEHVERQGRGRRHGRGPKSARGTRPLASLSSLSLPAVGCLSTASTLHVQLDDSSLDFPLVVVSLTQV